MTSPEQVPDASTYEVVLEPDEDGVWIARVPGVPGCHSFGRTLPQARARIREALGLWVDDADDANLEFTIVLDEDVEERVDRFHEARAEADRARREAHAALRAAAVALKRDAGISTRDAAAILELSHQRVAQALRDSTRYGGLQCRP